MWRLEIDGGKGLQALLTNQHLLLCFDPECSERQPMSPYFSWLFLGSITHDCHIVVSQITKSPFSTWSQALTT
jgi:hypothetical protein